MGAFYSEAMRVALATERLEIVGAFYNGVCKSWAHFIAGRCLQPWPQKELELKSWAQKHEKGRVLASFCYDYVLKLVKNTGF